MLDFQTLLHRLKTQIDTATGVLNVAGGDLEKLIRYSFSASSNSSARTRSTSSTRYVDEVAPGTAFVILRRIHTTGMKSKVHPTYKTKYLASISPA